MADEAASGQVKYENDALRYADGTLVEIGTLWCCVEEEHPLKNTRMTYLGLMRVNKGPDHRPEFHLSFRIEKENPFPLKGLLIKTQPILLSSRASSWLWLKTWLFSFGEAKN